MTSDIWNHGWTQINTDWNKTSVSIRVHPWFAFNRGQWNGDAPNRLPITEIRLTGFARVCETHIVLKKEDRMTDGTGFFKPLMPAPHIGTGLASVYADFIAFDFANARPRPAVQAGRGLFVCAERGARQGGARGARCIAPVFAGLHGKCDSGRAFLVPVEDAAPQRVTGMGGGKPAG